MIDVTALGEILIDFATLETDADGYPTMAANPGGAVCNFLAALTKYGLSSAFLGKVGDDTFGRLLVGTAMKAGIETRGIVIDSSVFTTLAFVTFDQSGDRSFAFARKPGADTCITFDELDLTLIDEARVFHFGTLSLTDEPARTCTQKAVAYAKDHSKLITFDPNLRLPLWRDSEEARRQILWGLHQADIVKISDNEVEFIFGCSSKMGADVLLRDYNVKLAMVTMGPDGCYLKNRNGAVSVACPSVKVMDTTGAGDIFGGSAVSWILKLGKGPEELSGEELTAIGRFAGTAASLSTQRSGGIPSISPETEVLAHMG